MRAWPIFIGGLALSGCAPSHEFAITSDEIIRRVELDLKNMKKSGVELVNPKLASADIWAGDSSGNIRVHLASGKVATCEVGYITSGDFEPHIFSVEQGQCNPVIQE
jgi:hypothetical protein